MDCPICYNKITHACVGTCMHHFCYPCLFAWCNRKPSENKITDCPTCRKPIFEIKFDREFDIINHGDEFPAFKHPNEHSVAFPKESKAGVTLKNNQGPGVKIVSVSENDQFYLSGLRQGHIILFINNIPCNNHGIAINIITQSQQANIPLNINTLTKV